MKAGGDEVWGYLPEAEDTGGDRLYWFCETCPLSHQCTPSSWKKAKIFSYVSEEACFEYLKKHLKHSSLHMCTEEEALEHLSNCEIKEEFETEETRVQVREEYMAHEEKDAKKKRAREAEEKEAIAKKRYTEKKEDWQTSWQRSSQKGQRAASSWRQQEKEKPSEVESALVGAVTTLTQVVKDLGKASSAPVDDGKQSRGELVPVMSPQSFGPRPPIGLPPAGIAVAFAPTVRDDVTLSRADCQSIMDGLDRIYNSLGHTTSLLVSTARSLTEEGQRIRAAHTAIQSSLNQ